MKNQESVALMYAKVFQDQERHSVIPLRSCDQPNYRDLNLVHADGFVQVINLESVHAVYIVSSSGDTLSTYSRRNAAIRSYSASRDGQRQRQRQ